MYYYLDEWCIVDDMPPAKFPAITAYSISFLTWVRPPWLAPDQTVMIPQYRFTKTKKHILPQTRVSPTSRSLFPGVCSFSHQRCVAVSPFSRSSLNFRLLLPGCSLMRASETKKEEKGGCEMLGPFAEVSEEVPVEVVKRWPYYG